MDSIASLLALGDHLPALPGHPDLPLTKDMRTVREDAAVAAAIIAHPDDEPAQIDAIAIARRYFHGTGAAVAIVGAYTAGAFDPTEAARRLAEPIERSYTTGDGGRLLVRSEQLARGQRQYHSPETALEMWGPEEDLAALEARVTDVEDGALSTEGQLWDLYYTILHVAKKTPWADAAAQQRLVDLMAALKARPDPPLPEGMTTAAANDWVWESGKLWSQLCMFGPSARETWNDAPGCGAGWYAQEVRAWTNVNAFVARLTAQGLADFLIYGSWALREALDTPLQLTGMHSPPDSREQIAEALFGAAAVWVRLAGRKMHESLVSEEGGSDITVTQWDTWHRRFTEEAGKVQYTQAVTQIARECAGIMVEIEGGERPS